MKLFNSVWYHKINCHHKFYFRQKILKMWAFFFCPWPWTVKKRPPENSILAMLQCSGAEEEEVNKPIIQTPGSRLIHPHSSLRRGHTQPWIPSSLPEHTHTECWSVTGLSGHLVLYNDHNCCKCLASLQSVRLWLFPNFPSLRTTSCPYYNVKLS